MSDSATEKVLGEKLEVNLAASKVDSAVANFHTTLANERWSFALFLSANENHSIPSSHRGKILFLVPKVNL